MVTDRTSKPRNNSTNWPYSQSMFWGVPWTGIQWEYGKYRVRSWRTVELSQFLPGSNQMNLCVKISSRSGQQNTFSMKAWMSVLQNIHNCCWRKEERENSGWSQSCAVWSWSNPLISATHCPVGKQARLRVGFWCVRETRGDPPGTGIEQIQRCTAQMAGCNTSTSWSSSNSEVLLALCNFTWLKKP